MADPSSPIDALRERVAKALWGAEEHLFAWAAANDQPEGSLPHALVRSCYIRADAVLDALGPTEYHPLTEAAMEAEDARWDDPDSAALGKETG